MRRSHLLLILLTCFFGFFGAALRAQNWAYMNPLPSSAQLNQTVYGNGVYVAVGGSANIVSSSDGVTWTLRHLGAENQTLNAVAFGNGRFVAVGTGYPGKLGSALIMTSTDGITWTADETTATNMQAQFYDVIHANGLWVITNAPSNRVLTSTDGLTWTGRPAGVGTTRMAHGNGRFVALSSDNRYTTSTDGVTWTTGFITGSAQSFDHGFEDIIFANNKFMVVGRDAGFTGAVFSSDDGLAWSKIATIPGSSLIHVTYLNGTYVTSGNTGGNTPLHTSPDGITWTARTTAMPPRASGTPNNTMTEGIDGLDAVNGMLFATGAYGTVTTSPDGVTWTRRTTGNLHDVNGLIWDGNRFVGTGSGGMVFTSPDGVQWTATPTNQANAWFGRVAFAAGRYVTAGIGGLYHSTDLATWTRVTQDQMYGVVHDNGKFVAAYYGGLGLGLRTSADGITWATVQVPGRDNGGTNGLAAGGGAYVVATGGFGGTPKIFRSTDAATWSNVTPAGLTNAPQYLAYGNDRFVLVASNQVWVSTDGATWTKAPAMGDQLMYLQHTGSRFIARSHNGGYLTSTDGNTWTRLANSYAPNISATAAVERDGRIYLAANGGTILRSEVPTPANPGRIVNMSIRTNAGTGDDTLIVGLAIGGTGTSGSKALLVRGVGPTLTKYGVSNALGDPILTAYQGNTQTAQNDDWAGGFDFGSVGAFPFEGTTPKDAALYNPALAMGTYSVQITGKAGASGISLAEIYDATPAASFTATSPRLINVSARARVGTGDGVLIAGFVIGGASPVKVLVRAGGPSLIPYGVAGALENPKLELYNSSGAKVAENDDWAGSADIKTAADSVYAFGYASNTSKDAALLVTLEPGSYTAQASGVAGTTGVALVEVYEVP